MFFSSSKVKNGFQLKRVNGGKAKYASNEGIKWAYPKNSYNCYKIV